MEDIMTKLTEKAVAGHIALKLYTARAMDRFKDDERGQGSVEYVGIILVVVAIVGVVIAAATTVGDTLVTKLTEAVNGIGGGGEG
jgi:Flp pilus assembly pilin Flp